MQRIFRRTQIQKTQIQKQMEGSTCVPAEAGASAEEGAGEGGGGRAAGVGAAGGLWLSSGNMSSVYVYLGGVSVCVCVCACLSKACCKGNGCLCQGTRTHACVVCRRTCVLSTNNMPLRHTEGARTCIQIPAVASSFIFGD